MLKSDDRPVLNPQKEWKGFPSDPIELLLLAHVNGKNSLSDLSMICARSVDETARLLEKLVSQGVVRDKTPVASESLDDDDMLVDRRFLTSIGEIDTRVLSEQVDLEPRRKEEILLLYHSLSRLNPFQLFGVRGDSTDKEVKRAYQKLSMRFHPDRYYGKNLGSFKPMMEKIFAVISQSLGMVSTPQARSRLAVAYPEAFAPDADGEGSPKKEGEYTSSDDSAEYPVRPARTHRRVGLRNQIAQVLSRTHSNSMITGDDSESASDDGEEREEIILPPPGGYKSGRPDHALARAAMERVRRVQAHLEQGQKAMADGNYSTAASHLKTLLSIDPKHDAGRRLYEEAERKSREVLGASYANRARMEEEMGDTRRAAELWRMAADMCPTVENLGAAAMILSKIHDHAKARNYAQQAVQMESSLANWLLLATVYLKAGMAHRAESTLKQVLEKHPGHPEIQRLLREARKMK